VVSEVVLRGAAINYAAVAELPWPCGRLLCDRGTMIVPSPS